MSDVIDVPASCMESSAAMLFLQITRQDRVTVGSYSYGFLWVPMGCWGHLHTCLQHHQLALRSGPENVARIDDQDMLQTVLQLP